MAELPLAVDALGGSIALLPPLTEADFMLCTWEFLLATAASIKLLREEFFSDGADGANGFVFGCDV